MQIDTIEDTADRKFAHKGARNRVHDLWCCEKSRKGESIEAYYLNTDHQSQATSPGGQKQDVKHNFDHSVPLIQGQNADS